MGCVNPDRLVFDPKKKPAKALPPSTFCLRKRKKKGKRCRSNPSSDTHRFFGKTNEINLGDSTISHQIVSVASYHYEYEKRKKHERRYRSYLNGLPMWRNFPANSDGYEQVWLSRTFSSLIVTTPWFDLCMES